VEGDDEFYAILHEQKGYPSWKWDYEFAIQNVISKYRSGKILDYGAGEGMFLCRIKDNWDCFATESGEDILKILTDKRISVFKDIKQIPGNLTNTFDVITFFQVLEHTTNFREVLSDCHNLLKKEGCILIVVPDCNATIRQTRLTGCHDMPPNHVCKWTPDSLGRVLSDTGFLPGKPTFEPSSLRIFGNYVHLKILSDAAKGHLAATTVYKIKNKKIRILGLMALALPTSLTLLAHFKDLIRGGSFAMSATPLKA